VLNHAFMGTGVPYCGQVTGHGLFVDIRGNNGPAVLFLHGGPGQGAYQFMAVQVTG
jgi:hypothetical protein